MKKGCKKGSKEIWKEKTWRLKIFKLDAILSEKKAGR